MGTIVGVHGTFAHMNDGVSTPDGIPVDDDLWWKSGSPFETKITALVASSAADGTPEPLKIAPFIWSGDNSEIARRAASLLLLDRLMALEAQGEPYVLIGHSHGGSVISSTLLTAAARKQSLPNLQRWITVGTPFIGMRPMPRLIDRLRLVQRVVLVASLMLLIMFLFYMGGQLIRPSELPTGANRVGFAWRSVIAAAMMSLPAVFFTVVYEIMDRRHLYYYRKTTIERARAFFGSRWLSFCHANDEAVQGLKSLPGATIKLFDNQFARQRLTFLAVFALPLAYLIILGSPPVIRAVADELKNRVYRVDRYDAVAPKYNADRQRIRNAVREIQNKEGKGASSAGPGQPPAPIDWPTIRKLRTELKAQYPDYASIERAQRFKLQFLEQNGKPCPGEILCGNGHDIPLNAALLFHIVTDDLTSALINDDTRFGIYDEALRVAIPVLLVPTAFISLALLFMLVLSVVARIVSYLLASVLNRVTLSEIKREIYGNDTDGEVAYEAGPRPTWMPHGRPYLPTEVARLLGDHADKAAYASLAKFRNAISAIAMTTGRPPSAGIVSSYLTWKELIHSTYFDLPEFQMLVSRAITSNKGFVATSAFTQDPLYATATTWLKQVDTPYDEPKTVNDKPIMVSLPATPAQPA